MSEALTEPGPGGNDPGGELDDGLVRQLTERARAEGLALTGEGG